MALQRFIETFIPIGDTFKQTQKRQITESEMKDLSTAVIHQKITEETKRYFESNPITSLKEKTVYRFPISKYDNLNENNRKYEKRLWKRVIDEQRDTYQGGIGLADHPSGEEEGRIKDSAIVWLNLGLDEANSTVWAEGILIGSNGKLAEEIMESGGRVGFSTSGFGELEESDKSTVRWDTYQLERVADMVLNPSQRVYGNIAMKVKKESEIKPSISSTEGKEECCACGASIDGKPSFYKDGKPCCCQACASADKKDTQKETYSMTINSKLSKLEERKFRKDVTIFLSEADKVQDYQQKLGDLQEILSYFSEGVASDLKEQIEKRIVEVQSHIQKAIKEHSKIVETFGVDTTEQLKEGVKKVAVDTQYYEKTASEWQKIAEGLQDKVKKLTAIINTLPTVEAYSTAKGFSVRMKELFISKEKELFSVIKELKKRNNAHVQIEKQRVQEITALSSANKMLKEKYSKLAEYTKGLKEQVKDSKTEKFLVEEAAKAKLIEEKMVHFRPQLKNTSFSGFNEDKQVQSYYADLLKRHGESIKGYESEILGCKTLQEAMKLYIEIIASLDTSRTTKLTEALPVAERKALIESQTGVRIVEQSNFAKRLPTGWE